MSSAFHSLKLTNRRPISLMSCTGKPTEIVPNRPRQRLDRSAATSSIVQRIYAQWRGAGGVADSRPLREYTLLRASARLQPGESLTTSSEDNEF